MGPIEKYLKKLESKRTLAENPQNISPEVQSFLDECTRLNMVLQDDKLFEKENQKHLK